MSGQVSLSSSSSRSLKDPNRPADLVLPPYQYDRKMMFDMNQLRPSPAGRQAPNEMTNTVQTIYKGRRADQITFDIGGAVVLNGNSEYAFPINSREQGELIAFTVSSNTPDMVTQCFLYDKRDRATILVNHTTTQLTIMARGMTYQEAHILDNLNISVDHHGDPHPVMPYAARHKVTFSKGFSDPTDYDTVKGTVNDKYFITDYAPTLPRAYERIYFNVINKSPDQKILHAMTLNRFVFVDEFETIVTPIQAPATDASLMTIPGQVANPPVNARRAKVRKG